MRRNLARTVVGLFVLSALEPAIAQERTFERLLREAATARESGDTDATIRLLQEAYALQPLPEILNNLARTWEEAGDYRQAFEAYRKVTDDPNADPNLRALDAARMTLVQARLGKAWVVLDLKPAGIEIAWDGEILPADHRGEFAVSPGGHFLEARVLGTTEVVLRRIDCPVDRRIRVTERLDRSGPTDGWIDVRTMPEGGRLTIEGYRLASSPDTLRVAAGTWRIEIGPHRVALDVKAGGRAELGFLRGATEPEKPKTPTPVLPAPVLVTQEPPVRYGPWILAGAGLATAGIGAGLLALAVKDRNAVTGASRDDRGVIIGMTYADARSREASANRKAVSGAVLVGTGTAAVAGGILWWLVSRSSNESGVAPITGPGMIGVRGAFW